MYKKDKTQNERQDYNYSCIIAGREDGWNSTSSRSMNYMQDATLQRRVPRKRWQSNHSSSVAGKIFRGSKGNVANEGTKNSQTEDLDVVDETSKLWGLGANELIRELFGPYYIISQHDCLNLIFARLGKEVWGAVDRFAQSQLCQWRIRMQGKFMCHINAQDIFFQNEKYPE